MSARSIAAVALELVPDLALAAGYSAAVLVTVFGDPRFALGLLGLGIVGFCLSGLGWLYINNQKVGLCMMVGRGALALAFVLVLAAAIGDAGDDYEPELSVLLIVTFAIPIISGLALGVHLGRSRTTR